MVNVKIFILTEQRDLETLEHLCCVTNQEGYKSSIAKHRWSTGHNLSFEQVKTIFKPIRISKLVIFISENKRITLYPR